MINNKSMLYILILVKNKYIACGLYRTPKEHMKLLKIYRPEYLQLHNSILTCNFVLPRYLEENYCDFMKLF